MSIVILKKYQMNNELLLTILNALFGGTGLISFIGARRERKASAKLKESEVFSSWQGIYDKMAAATDKKIEDLIKEIEGLKKELNEYKSRCKLCDKK